MPPALGHLLDVVTRRRVVGDGEGAGEAVEAVADGDVDGFAEDAIAPRGVGDDLGVAARDVEDDGVEGAGYFAAHFDVCGGGMVSFVGRSQRLGSKVDEGMERGLSELDVRPTQWFTPTSSFPQSRLSVRAAMATLVNGAPIPGPLV